MTSDVLADIERDLASPNDDARWQAAIRLGDYVELEPEAVWPVLTVWGCSEDEDTRIAISTCVLEHLLEHHFDAFFPRVEELAHRNKHFARTLLSVWRFGQTEDPAKGARLDALKRTLRQNHEAAQQGDEADEP